jgi:hypothetical protein
MPVIRFFWGTVAGTVPIPKFYSPEHVQRIVSAAEMRSAATTSKKSLD